VSTVKGEKLAAIAPGYVRTLSFRDAASITVVTGDRELKLDRSRGLHCGNNNPLYLVDNFQFSIVIPEQVI
jgi:hypothetical protein